MINPPSYEDLMNLCRFDFPTFSEAAFKCLHPAVTFVWNPYIDVMASRLVDCANGLRKHTAIAVPPRCLKSHMASIALPAWLLGQDPSMKMIFTSYGQDLGESFARQTRTLMKTAWYRALFPYTRIAREAVHDFATSEGGYRLTASVGGPLTGRGADLIVIDDASKPDETLSENTRNGINWWFDNTLRSRLNSQVDGRMILVMQRLHQDDLFGYVTDKEEWDELSFPIIATENKEYSYNTITGPKVYRREIGDLLDPERFPLSVIDNLRKSLGEYTFSSQYLQTPVPLGGNILKKEWLHYYEEEERPRSFSTIVQSWDTANKSGELNDYSVCTTWGYHNGVLYLLHVYREKLDYPTLRKKLIELAKRWSYPIVLIEDKASGTQLIQDVRVSGVHVRGIPRPPSNDKTMRFHSVQAEFEQGKVRIPVDALWLDAFRTELLSFPAGKHDDQVDSTTQAIEYCRNMGGARGGFYDGPIDDDDDDEEFEDPGYYQRY